MPHCVSYKKCFLFVLIMLLTFISQASTQLSCPIEPPPGECDVSDEFLSGRVAFTQLNGTYEISGSENYWEGPPNYDYFTTSGSLQIELVGGTEENYLDIDCDGSVTGQGKDKITGTITKEFDDSDGCKLGGPFGLEPNEMNWNIEIERTFSITGDVTNTGELELELSIDEATLTVMDDSNFIINVDCGWGEYDNGYEDLDVSGYVEKIKLLDPAYDPKTSNNWNPELTILDDQSWLEKMGQHFIIENYEPELVNPANIPEENDYYLYTTMFFQDTVTAELTADYQSDPKSPVITDLKLDEEKYYLLDVDVDTSVTVTVDWKESDETREIEFTYGSTTETVSSDGDETNWTFDAGEEGTSIKAKAISGSGDSQEWEINTNKIAVPAWAKDATYWTGTISDSSIQYKATLDWPVSLETTQTIDTLSLMTGLWGVSGSASSEFKANASSDGSPTNGSLTTSATINLAGKNFSFDLNGSNTTTLSCDALTTYGDATAQFSGLNWQKTLNPITAIPGLVPAVCGLSGALCNLINSFGIKGEVDASITGDGTFMDENSEIKWDSGTMGGSLSAQISINAIPKALRSLASIGVEGGGSGCIEFEFSPNFNMNKLGGDVNVGATVKFFGLGVNPSQDWPFGDACVARNNQESQGVAGWVPADGQLAMAVSSNYAAAVWSELPSGQNRPSGDIKLRIWDGNAWGTIIDLTNDADADMAPSVEFDSQGNLVIVYQRSTETLPTMVNELDTFANGLELHYVVYDPVNQIELASGQMTSNSNNDFGPVIKVDNNNDLHVFWQRANGSHIFGNESDRVSIQTVSWDSINQNWINEETVADNLKYTLGWSAASYSDDKMLITLLLDTDDDFTTNQDRELFHISKINGFWESPIQLTNNAINDDAPLSTYTNSGEPVILWRQDGTVMQKQGNLSDPSVLAFTSMDSLLDDGIGLEFGDGLILESNYGLTTFWQNSTKIEITSSIEQTDWTHLGQVNPNDGAQAMLNAKLIGTNTVVAYSVREFENNNSNLSEFVTPMVQSINLISDEIFSNGFESK